MTPVSYADLIEARFRLPDELWTLVRPLLPPTSRHPRGGRPRRDDRQCMEGILYLLTTGIQWRALPRCFGPVTTLHDRFQEWTRAGVFEKLWAKALFAYDDKVGISGPGKRWMGR